ncbi:MAG: type III-B CRISPR module RAMP protein Cmr6 [Fimbriimonadales bacterium]|nr:type III-B CRISPR module RAMP protein Cmr6 [Fimbriimonadales bacterium]
MRQAISNLHTNHLGIAFNHALGTQPEQWIEDKERRNRAKEELIERLVGICPDPMPYRSYLEELRSVLGDPIEVRFAGPLAVGLGQGHLLEQGLTLHWLFGTPLIHGSAVKGLCLREALLQCGLLEAAEQAARLHPARILDFGLLIERLESHGRHDEAERARGLQQVFGDPEGSGQVRFHDALWVPDGKAPLVADVTTPHNQKWYMPESNGARPLPDDMLPPIPVKNLVVRPGSQFLFWVVPRHDEWREPLTKLLLSALQNLGIGAKTNSGYGAAFPSVASATPRRVQGDAADFEGGKPVQGQFTRRGVQAILQLPRGDSLVIVNPEACGDAVGKKFRGRAKGNQVWIDGQA